MDPQVPMEITDDDKLWALLSWLLAPLVPVVMLLWEEKKVRSFIKYNAVQALVVGAIGYVVSSILAPVLIGCVTGPAVFIYTIVLAVQSYQGNVVTVPFVTDFCKNQGWI